MLSIFSDCCFLQLEVPWTSHPFLECRQQTGKCTDTVSYLSFAPFLKSFCFDFFPLQIGFGKYSCSFIEKCMILPSPSTNLINTCFGVKLQIFYVTGTGCDVSLKSNILPGVLFPDIELLGPALVSSIGMSFSFSILSRAALSVNISVSFSACSG